MNTRLILNLFVFLFFLNLLGINSYLGLLELLTTTTLRSKQKDLLLKWKDSQDKSKSFYKIWSVDYLLSFQEKYKKIVNNKEK